MGIYFLRVKNITFFFSEKKPIQKKHEIIVKLLTKVQLHFANKKVIGDTIKIFNKC